MTTAPGQVGRGAYRCFRKPYPVCSISRFLGKMKVVPSALDVARDLSEERKVVGGAAVTKVMSHIVLRSSSAVSVSGMRATAEDDRHHCQFP